jgi:hypothetical protein
MPKGTFALLCGLFGKPDQIEVIEMKRVLFALAGLALYRWWSSEPAEPAAPPAPPKRTPPRRKPVEPA